MSWVRERSVERSLREGVPPAGRLGAQVGAATGCRPPGSSDDAPVRESARSGAAPAWGALVRQATQVRDGRPAHPGGAPLPAAATTTPPRRTAAFGLRRRSLRLHRAVTTAAVDVATSGAGSAAGALPRLAVSCLGLLSPARRRRLAVAVRRRPPPRRARRARRLRCGGVASGSGARRFEPGVWPPRARASGAGSSATGASLRMSMRQPVSRAASRAFWPSAADGQREHPLGHGHAGDAVLLVDVDARTWAGD